MTGVVAVRKLLVADGTLTALVPAARIVSGTQPLNATLPAITLNSVSKVDRNIPSPGSYRHVRERVQVTVHASTYASQRAVLAAVRGAAADQMPTVSGLVNVTVHTDGAGPDMINEQASIYQTSQDFSVTYSEAT